MKKKTIWEYILILFCFFIELNLDNTVAFEFKLSYLMTLKYYHALQKSGSYYVRFYQLNVCHEATETIIS